MDDEHRRLAAKAKSGDREALNRLLEHHLGTVHKYVSMKIGPQQADVDDVVQDTLIAAAGSIRGLRGASKTEIAAWLLAVARHKIADHLRASYRHPHESIGESFPNPQAPVDQMVVELDRAERLRLALGRLTHEQEEVLVLRFVLGFPIHEVAEITGRPPGAVKSMQHRAIASLQQMLRAEEKAWR